jgi:hypothetical protein
MELTPQDKTENEILNVLVEPRTARLYDYYINGLPDNRTMLQREMLRFCVDLCPNHASEIRQCISELRHFVIFPPAQTFTELKEKDPPKINKRSLLFPMGKLVKEDRIDLSKEKEDDIKKWGKNFSIWQEYNIHIESQKKKTGKSLFNIFK